MSSLRLYLSACLSVNRASFRHWELPLTCSVTPCLLNIGSTSTNKDTSVCNFVANSGLGLNFTTARRSSQRAVNVVRPRWTLARSSSGRRRLNEVDSTCYGRRSADQLGQFVALSVYRCVQHNASEAARRAGQSAIADTCVKIRFHFECLSLLVH